MKKLLLAILALTLTGSVMAQNRNQATVTFFVNFHCGSDIRLIERNLPHEKGVTNFKTDIRGRSIEITYNTRRTNPEKLRKALEKMDFIVKNTFEEITRVAPRRCG